MVKSFEQASGKAVPYKVQPRRAGDLPSYYADPKLARDVLGWQVSRGVDQMCADTWRWQSENPGGYKK
jgi:UDP-glucose 4-epimerase